jgi:hypothetical protein
MDLGKAHAPKANASPATEETVREGGTASMMPPSFALTANSLGENQSKSAEKTDDKDRLEELYWELVGEGHSTGNNLFYERAIRLIMQHYGWSEEHCEIAIGKPERKFWATTDGLIKEGCVQTITFNKALFDQDFTFVVRTVGHEYQHVLHRTRKSPETNLHVSEFLSYSWEVLSEEVPAHKNEWAILESIEFALKHYKKMPREVQENYSGWKIKLLAKQSELNQTQEQ